MKDWDFQIYQVFPLRWSFDFAEELPSDYILHASESTLPHL